jgi:hypothetical protein
MKCLKPFNDFFFIQNQQKNNYLTLKIADYFWTQSNIWSRVTMRFKSSV